MVYEKGLTNPFQNKCIFSSIRSTSLLKTLWEKENLLVTSNFSFSHNVSKRLVLQTRENQGLFGKGLKYGIYYDYMDR